MRVAALVEAADHVCCRYRLAAFRPALEAAGHTLTLTPLPRGLFARARLFHSLRAFDLVVLQRKLLTRVELSLLRRAARRLLFDFDDAVWLRDSYSSRGLHSARRQRRFVRTVRAADLVFAGNRFLAEQAERFARPGVVSVLPTCVEPNSYPLAEHRPGPLRLVWVGSASTLRGLQQARPMLDAVAAAVPDARLMLVCDRSADLGQIPVDLVPWSEATEATAIAEADVGIAWMPDDDWSHGKCGLKVLQYQAAGLPVVANRVGVHTDMVRPDETGYLADTPAEWAAAVARLADPNVRTRFGLAGRRHVEWRYSVAVGGRLWTDALAGRTAAAG